MRYRIAFIVGCCYIAACSPVKHNKLSSAGETIRQILDSVNNAFAPDKRTVLFKVDAIRGVLKGETTSAAAKDALVKKLTAAGLSFLDSITVLPSPDLGEQTRALVSISVANIRTQPSHRAELATQATMGTPLHVWKKERGWYLVQTPDHYLGWVDGDAIQRKDPAGMRHWQQQPKLIFTSPYGFAYEQSSMETTVSDLVYGDVMALINVAGDHFAVVLPDGRKAYIRRIESMRYTDWQKSRYPTPDSIIGAARKMMGVPYLWGGTSFKGVDCSGFTKTVFFMNGLVLPRDAYQQVQVGEDISTVYGWQHLQRGDLLFFGSPAKDSIPERVVHVGIWIGNGEFIHASGRVQVASLDPAASNYDPAEHKRFLRAKRIRPQAGIIDLRSTDLFERSAN